jgi:hypothetical protein
VEKKKKKLRRARGRVKPAAQQPGGYSEWGML